MFSENPQKNVFVFCKAEMSNLTIFVFFVFPGVRFRRQHWCLLSIFILVLVLCIAIGLPISNGGPPSTPEARLAAVKQLLKEVPLIDG